MKEMYIADYNNHMYSAPNREFYRRMNIKPEDNISLEQLAEIAVLNGYERAVIYDAAADSIKEEYKAENPAEISKLNLYKLEYEFRTESTSHGRTKEHKYTNHLCIYAENDSEAKNFFESLTKGRDFFGSSAGKYKDDSITSITVSQIDRNSMDKNDVCLCAKNALS